MVAPHRQPARPTQRRDPAPSIWAYRWNRLWLTPAFRRLVRMGVPMLVFVALVGGFLASPARRDMLTTAYADLSAQFQNRPEFMVELLSIEGASDVLAEAIRGDLALALPLSSFALDLESLRKRVEAFDAVARADLRFLPGGILRVDVSERLPALVWRTRDDLWLIDENGKRVAQITARALRGDLALVAGEGADVAAPEALRLIAMAQPLHHRLRGLVRVAGYRWDLVLDRDQRILLPGENAEQALRQVIAEHAASAVLDRDILTLDLRNPRRPTARLGENAAQTLLQVTFADPRGARP